MLKGGGSWERAFFTVLQLEFLVQFYVWSAEKFGSVSDLSCWPYFQSCGDWKFLVAHPDGYSYNFFYSIVFFVWTSCSYCAFRKKWKMAQFLMACEVVWSIVVFFVLSYQVPANYFFFHIPFAILFLVAKEPYPYLRLLFVYLYSVAGLIKLNSTWITGSYFSALQNGMFLFADELIPYATNSVILMESFVVWFLFSNNKIFRRAAIVWILLFSFYSMAYVGWRYPIHTLLKFGLLFVITPKVHHLGSYLKRLSLCLYCALFVAIGFLPFFVSGDERYTLKTYRFGLGMFDANHQCVSIKTVVKNSGESVASRFSSRNSSSRCSPYQQFALAQKDCVRPNIEKVGLEVFHSINGGPLYEIINESDICKLKYYTFGENPWLRSPTETTPFLGWPGKNFVYGSDESVETFAFDQNQPSKSQNFFARNIKFLNLFWLSVWALSFLFGNYLWCRFTPDKG